VTESLLTSIVTLLAASPTVTTICGNRIYPDKAPQKSGVPYVVMTEITGTSEESHDEANNLDATDIQFSCYSATKIQSLQLRKAVRAALLTRGALSGVAVIRPVTRGFYDDEVMLCNSILEATFMHNPST
jgi:hypothetical protein